MYIVIEVQNDGNQTSTLTNVYEDKDQARGKYYEVLAFAAQSALPYHSALLIDEKGEWMIHDYFDRREPNA